MHTAIGGSVIRAAPTLRGGIFKEPVTDSRTLGTLKGTGAIPGLDWTMNLKILGTYIETYAMPTAQGAITAHSLGYTDGAQVMELKKAMVDRCNVTITRGGSVRAELSAIGEDLAVFTPATFLTDTEAPIDWLDCTLDIGGAITNWREMAFGVNNNVAAEFLGTGLVPSDVEALQAEYFGHAIISRKSASQHAAVLGASETSIAIALTNNETSPVTRTYTFAKAVLKTSNVEVPGLGLELERIEWEAPGLVIN